MNEISPSKVYSANQTLAHPHTIFSLNSHRVMTAFPPSDYLTPCEANPLENIDFKLILRSLSNSREIKILFLRKNRLL